MRTSILICATCLLVTGCSAQFRLPSLSSALSSLTGFGSGGSGGSSGASNGGQQSAASSAYSGLVRDYGRNLMMAMSSIYPTLFKPPQQQQAQQPQGQPAGQSPFEQFSASQQVPFLGGQSGPSFSFGGSTFSISPSFPFGGSSQAQNSGPAGSPPQQAAGHSPFSGSFGSSINSPPSFGPLSSSPFLAQSMNSFAPASSYSAAFEAANGGGGGPNSQAGAASQLFASLGQGPSSMASGAQALQSGAMNSYAPLANYNGQHDSPAQLLSQPSHHQTQSVGPQSAHQSAGGPNFGQGAGPQQSGQQQLGQYPGAQQFRPDMMSLAASAPVPSSSSYSNYGNVQAQQGQAQGPSSYQQPSYR